MRTLICRFAIAAALVAPHLLMAADEAQTGAVLRVAKAWVTDANGKVVSEVPLGAQSIAAYFKISGKLVSINIFPDRMEGSVPLYFAAENCTGSVYAMPFPITMFIQPVGVYGSNITVYVPLNQAPTQITALSQYSPSGTCMPCPPGGCQTMAVPAQPIGDLGSQFKAPFTLRSATY